MKLTRDLLDFQISYVGSGNQTNFDNNKFYTFKLHRYTNIYKFDEWAIPTKDAQDIEIPLVPCKRNNMNDGNFDLSATMFCPDYKDTDILKGSYYTS